MIAAKKPLPVKEKRPDPFESSFNIVVDKKTGCVAELAFRCATLRGRNSQREEHMKANRIFLLLAIILAFATIASPSYGARKFPVTFAFSPTTHAQTVTLAGNFNNWNKNAQPMEFDAAKGTWTVTIELLEGEYQYKFVVDGEKWFSDPSQELKAADGFGGFNSVLKVGDYERFKQPASRGDGKILTEAVYHATELPYAQWVDSTTISLRIRLKKGDIDYCAVILSTEKDVREVPMKWFAQDGVFEYLRARIPRVSDPVGYSFKLRDGSRELYYCADDSCIAEDACKRFVMTFVDSLTFFTPRWAAGRVFYQIFPERFRNGDITNDPPGAEKWDAMPTSFNFFGGDLQGVIDGLGYLDSLGIGAIYFNPIFEATSSHKYNTADYMKIDSHFGTLETFRNLLEQAHKRDIRIVLDGVFNHSGYEFWAFQDVVKNGATSNYVNWYTFHGFPVVKNPKPNYECWWGFGDLPKLNTDNPEVRKYIFGVDDYWVRQSGIDGWRLDVPNEVPHDFWKEFRKMTKSIGNDKFILGEIWDNGAPWLRGDEFDAVMNYRFRRAVIDFFATGEADPERFDEILGILRMDYPDAANDVMFNLIGSHDTERFLTLCGDDVRKMKLAVLFQMTYPGSPCVYYGDEIGLTGGKDPDCRKTFRWDKRKQNRELLGSYERLVALRNNHPSLRYGDYLTLLADRNRSLYAFARDNGSELAVIVINNDVSKQPVEIDMSKLKIFGQRNVPEASLFRDALTGKAFKVKKARLAVPALEPKSGLVLFIE